MIHGTRMNEYTHTHKYTHTQVHTHTDIYCARIPFSHSVARMHRMPCLFRSFSVKEPYDLRLSCRM